MGAFGQTAEIQNDAPGAVLSDIPPPVDAAIHIIVANKELEAYISIEPPNNGGAAPTFEAMQGALSEHGISYNVNIEKLKEIETAPVYRSEILIDQARAGLDILTTGDYHLDEDVAGRSWHHYMLQRWKGLEHEELQSAKTRSPLLSYPVGSAVTSRRMPRVPGVSGMGRHGGMCGR